ncbi:hypothetical protein AS96_14115 [Microbacterium sp. MRS-1]|nr:hypothetical protein AS96_14115 [Microbacterium sp. MRS-1]
MTLVPVSAGDGGGDGASEKALGDFETCSLRAESEQRHVVEECKVFAGLRIAERDSAERVHAVTAETRDEFALSDGRGGRRPFSFCEALWSDRSAHERGDVNEGVVSCHTDV